jgi:hypothetical protein
MPEILTCRCGKKLRVKDEHRWRAVRCPGCGETLQARPADDEGDDLVLQPDAANAGISWQELGLPAPRPGSREAMASNPGRVRVDFAHYYRCWPTYPTVLALLPFAFMVPALLWHWSFWIGTALCLVLNWLYWSGARWQGLYGEVNPALVISADPYLIAVLTDMDTSGDGPKPAIKVLPHALQRMTGGPPVLNTRLATVSMYWGNGSAEQWTDFFPEVINCMTRDEEVIRRVLATISEDEWKVLTEGIGQVPKPYHKGIFFLKGRDATE